MSDNRMIVLVRPPEDPRMYAVSGLDRKEPPLSLCYLAAVLAQEGYRVKIIDGLLVNGLTECVAQIQEESPWIVGITCNTITLHMAIELAGMVRQSCPNAFIGLGGQHASALPKKTLEDYGDFDFLVFGEGEQTLLEVVRANEKENGSVDLFGDILGLAYRRGTAREVILNKPRPLIKNLDALPLPARHLLGDINKYVPQISEYYRLPSAMMLSSRGCPYGCVFCSRSVFGRTYRAHSPEHVLKEIEQLVERGVREVRFVDDLFTLDRARVMAICDGIISRKLNLTWSCEMRVDTADSDMVRKMRQAGCWAVGFGIESGDPDVLKIIDKKINLDLVRKAVSIASAEGIFVRGFFMLGHPSETKESIRRTIDFAKSLPLDVATFSIVKVHPQTQLHEMVGEYGTMHIMQSTDDWAEVARHGYPFNVFLPHGLTLEYLERMQVWAHKEFFLRPRYIARQILRALTDWCFLVQMWRGGLVLLRMIVKKESQPQREPR